MATIKEGIEYAKVNPDSAFATELRKRIESGQMNSELKQAGLSQYITAPDIQPEPTLGEKLSQRVSNVGTALKQGQEAGRSPRSIEEFSSGATKMLNAGASIPGQAFGAVGDIIGAGVQATGLDEPIAKVLKPVVESKPVQAGIEAFQSLPQETQDLASNVTNIVGGLTGAKSSQVAFSASKTGLKNLASTIDTAMPGKNLGQKAVDFISADPDKKVSTILSRTSPEEVTSFAKMAERAASDGEAPTPFEVTGEKLAGTTKILQKKLGEIGQAKSDIIQPMREGLDSFKAETKPLIEKLTSLKNSFTEIDKGSASIVNAIINDARTVATKMDADKFIDKLQDAIYTGNTNQTLARGSALDKQLRGIVGEYNTALKAALPKEYAELNAQYSNLIENLDIINRSLGEVVDGVPIRGASLIKQFFSPSGTKAKEIFEFIKKETNGEVDLAKDATLSKFTMELFDDPRARSLLQGIGDVPTTLTGAVTKVLERVGGERLQNTMRQSTLRKAGEISKPKGATPGSSPSTAQPVLKVSPSLNPTTSKEKVNSLGGYNFERAKGLSPENQSIEEQAFLKIVSSEDNLLKQYKAKHGKEINTDNFRPLFKEEGYNGANAAAVQEPSSYLAKKAFADALKNDGKFALFSAGGSGVGKSFGIKSVPELTKLKEDSAVVFDSNLSSYDSAIKKIKQVESAGKEFQGVYTYRNPIKALTDGVVKRMRDNPEEMGRIVPTKVIADNHIKSLEVVKKLINEGYNFNIVDNSFDGGSAKLSSLKEIESKAKYPSVKELTDIMNKKIKELYDRGELTPEQYKEYVN